MGIAKTCLEILNRLGPIDEKVKHVNLELEYELGKDASRQYMTAVMNRKVREDGFQFDVESNPVLAEIWKETERQLIESDQRRAANRAGGQVKLQEGLKSNDENQDAKSDVLDLFYQPPTPISLEERETHPEKKYYISDVIDMTELKRGKLNILYSPPGTGKTTFIERELKRYADDFDDDLLYLAPQTSLVDQLKFRGNPKKVSLSNGGYYIEWKQDGITAMTYSAFGYRIEEARRGGHYCSDDWWGRDSVICLDELSQAVHQSFYGSKDVNYGSKDVNYTALALKELVKRTKDDTNIVVTLSATPKASIDYFRFWNKTHINLLKSVRGLEGYHNKKEIGFIDLDSVLCSVDKNAKGLVYTKQIKQVKRAVDLLCSRGIRAMGIWSLNRQDDPMNEEQLKVRNYLVKKECYPDDLQVLVVNGAYETGINIRPEKTKLDYVIVNDSNDETIVQARGRYRSDIETLYKRVSKNDDKKPERIINHEVIEPYLGIRLDKKMKDELRGKLGFKDEQGRLIGWKATAEELKKEYIVQDKKSGSHRFSLISRK